MMKQMSVPQKMMPQPIPYQGSKRKTAPAILENFPSQVSRIVEPFAGSAAISIAVAGSSWCRSFLVERRTFCLDGVVGGDD